MTIIADRKTWGTGTIVSYLKTLSIVETVQRRWQIDE